MSLRLHTVICSTRPTRMGPAIAKWFHEQAQAHGKFDARLIDLVEFALPVFDEPQHPRMLNYAHEHTKRWSASVKEANAIVFVTPEYNHNPPPSLVNAIDFLALEWAYKPVGFISYGGIAAGVRAVQAAKLQASILRMVPVAESLAIPNFATQIKDGVFGANEGQVKSVPPLLDELHKLATVLQPLQMA